MVRAGQYDGDPAELCDAGNVPALREHRLLLRSLPDPAGQSDHRSSPVKHASNSLTPTSGDSSSELQVN